MDSSKPRPLSVQDMRALQPQQAKGGLSEDEKAANREREPAFLTTLFKQIDEIEGEPYEFSFPRKAGPITFRVRALTERELYAANEKASTYKTIRGIRILEKIDQNRLRSHLVIAATVDEDRLRYWENPQVLEHLRETRGVLNKADSVDCILRAGEKDQVYDRINIQSGFTLAGQAATDEVLAETGE